MMTTLPGAAATIGSGSCIVIRGELLMLCLLIGPGIAVSELNRQPGPTAAG